MSLKEEWIVTNACLWIEDGACVLGSREYVMAIARNLVDKGEGWGIITGWWFDTLGFMLAIPGRSAHDILERGL